MRTFLMTVFLVVMMTMVSMAEEPAAQSTDDVARELANPNTALATLNFKNQFRSFTGDLPGASDQSSYTLLFQPALPFPLPNGKTLIFRPAIPVLFGQPATDPADQGFSGVSGLGDIAFDLAYASTSATGFLKAFGLIAALPTATDGRLGSRRWTAGPELLLGKLTQKYVLGIFPNHQWDYAGTGDAEVSLTTIQVFASYLPAGGWNVGSSPIMTFNHLTNDWTIPLNLNLGKTVVMGDRPWKLSVEINYYVAQPNAFGPQWMIGLNVSPVVENGLASWFN